MSTFQERIQAYIGTVSSTANITDWLTAGAKALVNRIPEDKIEKVSTTIIDPDGSAGIASTGHRLVRAYKSTVQAQKVEPIWKNKLTDKNSRYYASTSYPAWYEEGGKAFVIPGGGTIVAIPYPSPAYNASSITNFPSDWEQAVVLYATIQGCHAFIESTRTAMVALTIGAVTPPTAPADFSFSGSVVIPTAPSTPSFTTINIPDVTITTPTAIALGTAPVYTKPTTTFTVGDSSTTNTSRYFVQIDEDAAKANAELNAQQALLDKYGKDLYNELNEYNNELEIYKATLQKNISQIQIDIQQNIQQAQLLTDVDKQQAVVNLNKEAQEYSAKLQLYSNQISSYSQVVNSEVNAYGALLSKYSASLNKYQADIQLAISTYQANLSKYNNNLAYYQTILTGLEKELERAYSLL